MVNDIIFLGTAGDSKLFGKQYRASGGIVIVTNNTQLHIDPGPGSLVRAVQMKVNVRETTGILVSNNTILKSSDVNALISGMTYEGLDHKGVVVAQRNVIEGNEDDHPTITRECLSYVEKAIGLEVGQKVGINDTEVLATKTFGTESIGFRITCPDFIIGYTSDTEYRAELASSFENVNVLIVNCKNPESIKEKSSMNTTDIISLVEKVKPSLTILTGFGIKMIEHDPISEARKIQKETGCQVMAAKDGLRINPTAYSAKNKQKRLQGF
jgi:ribonuclease BN (tRNA processing enzyme)